MDYFVNRIIEFGGFKKALNALSDDELTPPILLYHGESGIGKTCLLQEFHRILKKHPDKPLTIYSDCNHTFMTFDVLFNNIQSSLQAEFWKYFEEYSEFIKNVQEIQQEIEDEATVRPEETYQLITTILTVATEAIIQNVPNAAVFLGKKDTELPSNISIENGITILREKLASRRLNQKKYNLFLKDIQAEQCRRFADTLNKIACDHNRKMVLLIDQFDNLILTPNVSSDTTYYEYWRDYFLNNISSNILIIQSGQLDLADDYIRHLGNGNVVSFELKPFTDHDVLKVLSYTEMTQVKLEEYEAVVNLLIDQRVGIPITLELLKENFQGISSTEELEQIKQKIVQGESQIIDQSIEWILNNRFNSELKDLIFKIAICSSTSGKIDKAAIEYIFNTPVQEIQNALELISEQFSLIDCVEWTLHTSARKSILNLLNIKAKNYLQKINHDLKTYYASKVEKEKTDNQYTPIWLEYTLKQLYSTFGYSEEEGLKLLLNLILEIFYRQPSFIERFLTIIHEIKIEGIYEITEQSLDWIEFWQNYCKLDREKYSSHRNRLYWLKNRNILSPNNQNELNFHLGLIESHLQRYGEAVSLLEQVRQFFPERVGIHKILGKIYTELGRIEEAISSFQQAIDLDPDDPVSYNGLGKIYEKLGRQEDAIAQFQKAAEYDLADATPFMNLGKFYANSGRTEEAIAAYLKAIELDPDNAIPHNNLGTLYDRFGQKMDAIDEYRKAIELNPNYAIPYCNLGNVYADIGKDEEAIAVYQKAISLNPDFAYAHNNLGKMYDESGRKEEAIEEYLKASELDPAYAAPHNNLGTIYNDLGQNEDAIAEFQKAIELDPKDSAPHYNLGRIYYALGHKEEAIAEYEKASELNPEDAAIFYNLGKIYFDLGRKQESTAAYQRAYDLSKSENS